MMLDESLPIPLYIQLRNIVEKQIRSGAWKVDMQIPTEQELCAEYGVSRITVRKALNALEQDGLICRLQGRGTYVKAPELEQRLFTIYTFSEQIRKSGRKSSSRVLELEREPCSESIARRLQIEPGTPIHRLYRLRLVDNEPFAIETSYLPYSLSKRITREDVEQLGLYSVLKQYYNIEPDVMEEQFEAVTIKPQYLDLLKVTKGAAGIHLEHLAKCCGTIFEFCDCLIRGDRYKYSIVLRKY